MLSTTAGKAGPVSVSVKHSDKAIARGGGQGLVPHTREALQAGIHVDRAAETFPQGRPPITGVKLRKFQHPWVLIRNTAVDVLQRAFSPKPRWHKEKSRSCLHVLLSSRKGRAREAQRNAGASSPLARFQTTTARRKFAHVEGARNALFKKFSTGVGCCSREPLRTRSARRGKARADERAFH